MQKFARAAVVTGCAAVAMSLLYAQRGGGDWMTIGYDGQRSSWVRGDGKISPESMAKPGFALLWKIKLKNEPRQMSSITPPALLDFYIGYKGFRTLGLLGGSSGKVAGIDVDLGRIEWEKNLPVASGGGATAPCPGGMTASVTRPTNAGYPGPVALRGGRGGNAKGAVGAPLEGAVTIKQATPPAAAPVAPRGRKNAPAPNPFGRAVQWVNSIGADGKLHSMYVSNGEEPNPPVEFLPPNANAMGLIVYDDTAYVATVNGCGGVENGIWALNLTSKKVTHWKSNGGPAGSAGFAVGPEGAIFVAAGAELVALSPHTLEVKNTYKAGKEFTSSPVIFEHKGKDLLAVATADGEIIVLDSASLEAPLAKSAAVPGPKYAAGALSSWQDPAGGRWILAPTAGAIATFKLVEENTGLALVPGWVSGKMVSPIAPAIVNGVVFALSTGEFRTADAKITAAQRAQRSSKAVLYALDGVTGKEFWNSGTAMTSFVDSGGLASGGGRIYVGAHDGTLYQFGFPMEH